MKKHWGNPPSLQAWNSTSQPCDWPEIWCESGRVVVVRLAQMNITGTLPTTICELENILEIMILNNDISGTIPQSIRNCSKLETLDLTGNFLTGPIPGELFLLQNLNYLTLKDNMLSGELPNPIELVSLSFLDLSYNHLNGSIPADIGKLYNLSTLILSNNSLSGSIPNGLFRLPQLSSLTLGHNMLSGEIPRHIEGSILRSVVFSHNYLNGSIPEELGKLCSLSLLDLSNNSLSGSIPNGLFSLKGLSYLFLGHNSLSGGIPASMDFESLQEIDLSHNYLNGSIPKGFGELSEFRSLDLSDNQFSGDILAIVSHFSSKHIYQATIRLCSNILSGRIPYEFTIQASINNCFDVLNMCSNNEVMGLPSCPPSKLCSDEKFQGFLSCPPKKPKHVIIRVLAAFGGLVVGLVGLIVILFVTGKSRSKKRVCDATEWDMICFQKLDFTKWDILSSLSDNNLIGTGGLSDNNLIGTGGSGKVYRIPLNQTGKYVAVKWIWNKRKPGHRLEKEFLAEVQTLGSICHTSIVKLLCCISSKNTKLLVYEYMKNQSLHRWLHGRKKGASSDGNLVLRVVLDWPTRLQIAIRVAQGLSYMHHDCSPPIIHRDIKSSNILLDSEFCAKIADFGLAKFLTRNRDPETASAIAGTFGYIAPEYARTAKVNVKIDIYSFGVVLLELATGRGAVIQDEHINLAEWAWRHCKEEKSIIDALDEDIKEACFLEEMSAMFKLGLSCTATAPSTRPSMREVLQILHSRSFNRSWEEVRKMLLAPPFKY
ncbi:unnamed protein product [Ilex paraguariensis]|uniref:Protein kinase domain-containing protein n=1 Tax=Ilex paraguariensis TaxID=185542 RepID=A0ABC8UIR6_9AQUA